MYAACIQEKTCILACTLARHCGVHALMYIKAYYAASRFSPFTGISALRFGLGVHEAASRYVALGYTLACTPLACTQNLDQISAFPVLDALSTSSFRHSLHFHCVLQGVHDGVHDGVHVGARALQTDFPYKRACTLLHARVGYACLMHPSYA